MKAPDKIYINNYNGNDTWGNQWHPKPSTNPSTVSHEYIRKDALLEWAKEMKEQVSIGLNAYDMGEENGKAEMLNKLIDKLNSM